MRTTLTLSANLNINPFEVFNQDVDEVLLLINFYIKLGAENRQHSPTTAPKKSQPASGKQQRIRVNDATATGGWF